MRSSFFKALLLIFMLAGGIAACTKHRLPEGDSFQELVPEAWEAQSNSILTKTLRWNDFNDQALFELINTSLTNHPNIQSALISLKTSQINLRGAKADNFINYSVDSSTGINKSRRAPTSESYSVNGRASYEVDLWGNNAKTIKLSDIGLIQTKINLKTTRISLASEVANIYYQIMLQDNQLSLRLQSLEYAKKQLEQTRARHKAGLITSLDVINQEVDMQSRLAALEDLKNARKINEQRLAILVGKAPHQFELPEFEGFVLPELSLEPGTPSKVLKQRPDIQLAELGLKTSQIQFELAENALFPNLSINTNAGYSSDELKDLLKNSSLTWNIGANLVQTLLDNGARDRRIELSKLDFESQVVNYRSTILNALQEIESNLTDKENNQRQLSIQKLQLASQEELTKQTELRYKVGSVSGFDLTQQQATLLNTQEQLLQTRLSILQNTIALMRSLGIEPDIIES